MADIFDLAQKINAQRQRASQGYSSPLEMLPLQIGQLIATRDKEKRVSLKNDSVILSQLISGATSEDEINNVLKLANQHGIEASRDPETNLYGEFTVQKANQKRDDYNQFQASAEWVDAQLSKDDGKGASYFEMSEEELMTISPEELSKRMDELASFSGGMKEGLSGKFKYKKGTHSLDKLNKTFADYEQKLENAIAANITGGKITQEEAMAIMLGDFEGAKKTAESTIKANISNYNGQLKVLRKERMDIKTAMAEGGSDFAQYLANVGTDASGLQSHLEELDKNISDLDSALTLEYDRQYYWTGIGKKSGLESLTEAAKGGGTTGGSGDLGGGDGGKVKPEEDLGTLGLEQDKILESDPNIMSLSVSDLRDWEGYQGSSQSYKSKNTITDYMKEKDRSFVGEASRGDDGKLTYSVDVSKIKDLFSSRVNSGFIRPSDMRKQFSTSSSFIQELSEDTGIKPKKLVEILEPHRKEVAKQYQKSKSEREALVVSPPETKTKKIVKKSLEKSNKVLQKKYNEYKKQAIGKAIPYNDFYNNIKEAWDNLTNEEKKKYSGIEDFIEKEMKFQSTISITQ